MVSFTVKQGLDVVSQDSETTIFTWRCWLNFHKSNLIYSVKNLHYSTTPIPSNKLSNILFSLIYIQVLYDFLVSSFSLNYSNPQNLCLHSFVVWAKAQIIVLQSIISTYTISTSLPFLFLIILLKKLPRNCSRQSCFEVGVFSQCRSHLLH